MATSQLKLPEAKFEIKYAALRSTINNQDKLFLVKVYIPDGMTLAKARRQVLDRLERQYKSPLWIGFYDEINVDAMGFTVED